MNEFFIKHQGSFWSDHGTWTSVKTFAARYSFQEGINIIDSRWPNGIKKRTKIGDIYSSKKPILEAVEGANNAQSL